jgi:hypothetical protein
LIKKGNFKMKQNTKKIIGGVAAIATASLALLSPELAMAADPGGIGDIGKNLAKQSGGIAQAIYWLALVTGLGLVAYSLFAGYSASKPNSQTGWKPAIMAFIFGSALLSIAAITNVGSGTLGVSQTKSVDQVLDGYGG